jgi:hypothetical protein
MNRSIAALFVASVFFAGVVVPAAQAAPTQVNVRIEGETETLFEGPILTDGHKVRGLSDSEWRRCNALNNGTNPTSGPTPTASSVDAMRILGEPFDGTWYSQYDDYFITQWGPDRQDVAGGEYWGIVVNNVFTSIGGCQYRLDGGDEVLWIYDAFKDRPRLALYPANYGGGAVPLTATATLNQPFEVEVDSWSGYNEGAPPASPTRSTTPFPGAEVAPVLTDSKGFQKIDLASPSTVTTAADGKAGITFTSPGWHRIKATDTTAGAESAIRSNRLDVCVPAPPATSCGPPPADSEQRTPPPLLPEEEEGSRPDEKPGGADPVAGGGSSEGGSAAGSGATLPPAAPDRVRVTLNGLDRSRIAEGLIGVSWQIRDPGAGISKWTIASKTLGRRGAGFVARASGKAKSSARVRLPLGASYRLKITFVDSLGRSAGARLGKVRIPRP